MGATNCCSCSGVWRTTASPCTGGNGASAAAGACEQARTAATKNTDFRHFIAVSHGPFRGIRLSSLRRAPQRDRRGEVLPRRVEVLSPQRFPRRLHLKQRASHHCRAGRGHHPCRSELHRTTSVTAPTSGSFMLRSTSSSTAAPLASRRRKGETNMMDRLREWGFPIGLLLAWAIAAVFMVSALGGMEASVERTLSGPHLTHVVAHPATHGSKAAPAS